MNVETKLKDVLDNQGCQYCNNQFSMFGFLLMWIII